MPKKKIATIKKKCKKKMITHNNAKPQEIKLDVKSVKKMFKKAIINEIAQKSGLIKRSRKLNAFDFFLSLTFGSLKSSAVTLSAIIEDLSTKMSRVSVNERFNEQACCFFQEVYSHFFNILNVTKKNINVDLFKKFNEIKIIDSSSWKVPKGLKDAFAGFNKAGCKIQLMMNYKAGTISLFDLIKETTNDQSYSKDMFKNIRANDLCIFDLGYLVAQAIVNIHQQMAFFYLVSIPRVLPFTQRKETPFIKSIF